MGDERPLVYTLTLPPRDELRDNPRCHYWLKLADVALERARAEQAHIKEQVRPNIERYRVIRRKRTRYAA